MRISDCSSDVCSSDLTFVLRLQKMIAVWISSASIRSRSVSRLPRSDVLTRNCSIFSFRLAGRATSIIFGFDRNLSASFLIGGGIVAENSRVCRVAGRSEEHPSELQSLMRISSAVFCLNKKTHYTQLTTQTTHTSP